MKSAATSPRRSWLFTPGDNLQKIKKAADLQTDCVILDLEDAVPVHKKKDVRRQVVTALNSLDFGHKERFVRINPSATEFYMADLEAITGAFPDGFIVPKVETAAQIRHIDRYLSTIETANRTVDGRIRLFALIETAQGIMNIREIAQASSRLDGLMLGAEDLAADMGAIRSQAGWEVFYARSSVITAAAAYHLQAVDTIFTDFKNQDGLEEDALFARQMGYTGKMAIHPDQIDIINRIFSPSATEITQAQQLVQAYQEHLASGTGVFAVNGRMIDKPIILAAERLLERGKLAGLLDR